MTVKCLQHRKLRGACQAEDCAVVFTRRRRDAATGGRQVLARPQVAHRARRAAAHARNAKLGPRRGDYVRSVARVDYALTRPILYDGAIAAERAGSHLQRQRRVGVAAHEARLGRRVGRVGRLFAGSETAHDA